MCAALLLAARTSLEHLGLPCPSAEQIVAATGATRSRAYELVPQLVALLPSVARPPGRPAKPPTDRRTDDGALTRTVLDFVLRHPGCVDRGAERHRYSDVFRRFVIEQRERNAAMDLDVFAEAVSVPLGTLKAWLADPRSPATPASTTPATASAPGAIDALHVQTVLDAWRRWEGDFRPFCEHVRNHLLVPFGCDLVRRVLAVHGRRTPHRRGERPAHDNALRGAFQTYFPGAQWVADGLQIPVVVAGRRLTYNVELHVDAHSGAFVGLSVRDTEDAATVVESFRDGVATTAAPPIAVLLDNRPSNHAPEVAAALGDTIRVRATLERPQNKAHVEGAFGNFSRALPDLVLDTTQSERDLGRAFLGIVTTVWVRASNHRPRNDRQKLSRAELYATNAPDDAHLAQAKHDLADLARRQERARRTLEARCAPTTLALLDDHFARLGLLDPERHFRLQIARFPLDAITGALGIFAAKRDAGTLPDGADAAYLLGIVRNVAAKSENHSLAHHLLALRLQARDLMLAGLESARDVITTDREPADAALVCVDRSLSAAGSIEKVFWLDAAGLLLRGLQPSLRDARLLSACRRIAATFALPPRERQGAILALVAATVPLL